MNKKTKIALGIGAAGILGYLILSGSGKGEGGAFGGGGGGGGFEPILEPKKITTTSTSEDPGRVTNIYNFGGGEEDAGKFFTMPRVIEEIVSPKITPVKPRVIEITPSYTIPTFYSKGAKKAGLTPTQTEVFTGMSTIGMKLAGVPVQYIKTPSSITTTTKKASTATPTPTPTPAPTTKKSSITSTIKSAAIAAVTMSQPISFAKSVSSFVSSWWG